jgi:hypothetical protein
VNLLHELLRSDLAAAPPLARRSSPDQYDVIGGPHPVNRAKGSKPEEIAAIGPERRAADDANAKRKK